MADAIEVEFKGQRLDYFVNPDRVAIASGDKVLVEAERGVDLGEVRHIAVARQPNEKLGRFRSILRRATSRDLKTQTRLRAEEAEAVRICRERVKRLRLDMKLIDAESQHDGNLITFFFTAEQRVDFRELVKELASIFKTRIELRQIGARDAAKRIGGIGPCGREYCCSTWLKDFSPVTLKMAKNQGLALAPTKISGGCGRLMCCLMYEDPFYKEVVKLYPKQGAKFEIGGELVVVSGNDYFRQVVRTRNAEGVVTEYAIEDFPVPRSQWRGGAVRPRGAPGRGGAGSGCHKPDPRPTGMKNARGRRENDDAPAERSDPGRRSGRIPITRTRDFEGAPLLAKGRGRRGPSDPPSGDETPSPVEMVRLEAEARRRADAGDIGSGRSGSDRSDAELVAFADAEDAGRSAERARRDDDRDGEPRRRRSRRRRRRGDARSAEARAGVTGPGGAGPRDGDADRERPASPAGARSAPDREGPDRSDAPGDPPRRRRRRSRRRRGGNASQPDTRSRP